MRRIYQSSKRGWRELVMSSHWERYLSLVIVQGEIATVTLAAKNSRSLLEEIPVAGWKSLP